MDLVNVTDRLGETALSMVVQAGRLDVVKILCELGANPMSLHMDLETESLMNWDCLYISTDLLLLSLNEMCFLH